MVKGMETRPLAVADQSLGPRHEDQTVPKLLPRYNHN